MPVRAYFRGYDENAMLEAEGGAIALVVYLKSRQRMGPLRREDLGIT